MIGYLLLILLVAGLVFLFRKGVLKDTLMLVLLVVISCGFSILARLARKTKGKEDEYKETPLGASEEANG